jgi:hypothetical protein
VSSDVVRGDLRLLVFHAYVNEVHGSRSKIPSTKCRPYTYDVKFLALLGAPYIFDISRLRVKQRVTVPLYPPKNPIWTSRDGTRAVHVTFEVDKVVALG